MKPALLDVNFLLALAWPQHQFAASAASWFRQHQHTGWFTCTVTQLAFIRLSSNPTYLRDLHKSPGEAKELLLTLTRAPHHRFLPDPKGPLSLPKTAALFGHQQVTDAYLIGLAHLARGRVITYDQRFASLANDKSLVEILRPAG